MGALLAMLLSIGPVAPIELQSIQSLRQAQQSLRSGDRGRGLATLDSLLLTDGVTVAMEEPSRTEGAVERGLQVWNDVLGERAFRLRPAGNTADVTVRFVRTLEDRGENVQGFVEASRDIAWSSRSHSYRLKATIYVRDNVDGRPMRAAEIMSVVAHESGHLLGLADVDRDDCLMGPMTVGRPLLGPTPEEIDAVRGYRSLIRRSYPKAVDKR